jgi:phosphoribosylamine-glycine ligase
MIFHAGTKIVDNELKTAGGRVLAVSALANTITEAADKAYSALSNINFPSIDYRKDIGLKTKASIRTY